MEEQQSVRSTFMQWEQSPSDCIGGLSKERKKMEGDKVHSFDYRYIQVAPEEPDTSAND